MDTKAKKYIRMKDKLEEIAKTKNRLKGRLEGTEEELRNMGFRDVKHAKKELRKLKEMEKKLSSAIDKQVEEIEGYDCWD